MAVVLKPAIILTVFMLMLQIRAFTVEEVSINEPVTFLCTCPGSRPVVEWTRFIPSKAVIAKCHGQTCQIEQPWQKRFIISGDTSKGNFSMRISSTVYNDAGSYMCTCDGSVTDIKLNVYVPTVIKAFVGHNATLPCYGDTRSHAKNAQWKKDKKKLLEYPNVPTDEASVERFTMSKEGFPDGDLSLNISSVQQSDAGFYLCLIQDESRNGDPRAVVLKVEEQPEQQPEQQPATTTNNFALGLGVALALLVLVDIIRLINFCVGRYRRRQDDQTTSAAPGAPVQEQSQPLVKYSSTQPIQD